RSGRSCSVTCRWCGPRSRVDEHAARLHRRAGGPAPGGARTRVVTHVARARTGAPAEGVARARAWMSTPPAFTAEQVALLQAAFEHVWSRMSRLQGDLNDNASNVATLLSLLVERGLLTPEQFEAAVEELTAT